MAANLVYQSPTLQVLDYVCEAGPGDVPFSEVHASYCLAFVRRGSFGYAHRGRRHELVSGSLLLGAPDDEFCCTHEHHAGGDECLSIHFGEELATELNRDLRVWGRGQASPLPELMVLGVLAQAAHQGDTAISLEEAALLLLSRYTELHRERPESSRKDSARDRKHAVDAALWLNERSSEELCLNDVAAEIGLSSYHFLRVFSRVIGVTPHQYLLRCRLAHAARLLTEEARPITEIALDVGFADLSNFVRTFRRAAGASPRAFRKAAHGDRKILQERLARLT
ncbi:MAG: helix-turn-helix transcriptional regulator [Polyangiaceae bacterium]